MMRKSNLTTKVSSGQHCEILTRKIISNFDFDPENGLKMGD